MVPRRSCFKRRGVSREAFSRNVYGPGVWARSSRYCQLSTSGVFADVREIAAHQREMMIAIGLANVADALERRLVADVAAERVARIGRIDDHRRRRADTPPLGE